ncbi:cordon-bleu protein-like 1 isoform X3 [Entelurus aequoreus]|uniref:cordon-bleu protein-like 1 isoform X3 n=1 Tax=Entelurus aequoreus TaxID=161455 RepID=UPI002B1E70B0|nr:cordon-bleu protein-like 1 isoform X3 [Entelurus aequoreus]XP_061924752.1 cordon-bleu protein-like 1 isoform X3 [Entelurus aequoreus]
MDVENFPHSRVSTKSKAPSPPALKSLDSSGFSRWYPGNLAFTMDHKENLVDKDLSLVVVLPDGVEKMTTVHGSKPLMDLLVTLCARYHLNPSSYTLELLPAGRHDFKLKPSALIGTLEAEKVVLKARGDDKNKKVGPHMPEATVRMVINYKKSQKTILRVSPQVPLTQLLPAICEKCEFAVESTLLFRDLHSPAPLDLSWSLNHYAIREVYARGNHSEVIREVYARGCGGNSPPPACLDSAPLACRGHVLDSANPAVSGHVPDSAPLAVPAAVTPGKNKTQKEKENKGLFSKFRKSKKTSVQATTASAPASPVLVIKPRPLSMALPRSSSPPLTSPTSPGGEAPKKRRAPQPPILVSQNCHTHPGTRQRFYSVPNTPLDCHQVSGPSPGSSAESSLKRPKRKAPLPPTPPGVTVPDTVFAEENTQELPAAETLEEIMEETSAAATQVHGEDPGLPDLGDDQCGDLSSDGKAPQISGDTLDVKTLDGTSHLTERQSTPEQPGDEDGVHGTDGPQPSPQGTGTSQASVGETSTKETSDPEHLGTKDASPPSGEDAQVQTDPAISSANQTANVTTSPDLTCSRASGASSCQDSTPKSHSRVDFEPKPSNELTRDYVPKAGMTTYTVVPPKSNEKLRYFEVALTLELPPAVQSDGEGPQANDRCLAQSTPASPPSRLRSPQEGPPGEVRATKVPPATKPKPGSFRLSKHKKTAGYYVTSAADKTGPASVDQVDLPPHEGATAANDAPSQVRETRQSKEQRLSLEKLRSFATPRPFSPSTPSRFAQAVSFAVRRSHSLPRRPESPGSPLRPSPPAAGPGSVVEEAAVLDLKGQVPGVQGQVPGVQGQVPGVQGQVPGVQGQVPGVQDQVPEVQGQVPGVQSQTTSSDGSQEPPLEAPDDSK